MAERLTLFFFPSSYYSGKALLALLERGIPFARRVVDLAADEQNEPWFLGLNPSALVPVLQDGDKVIPESEEIIKYIDTLDLGQGPHLIPADGTPARELYDEAHALLTQNVPVPSFTFGLFMNPDLSVTGLKDSAYVQQKRRDMIMHGPEKLRKIMEANPDLRDAYQAKLNHLEAKVKAATDRDEVKKILDELQGMFDQLEAQLAETTKTSPGSWLTGFTFSAVDVTLYILLNRLFMLGLEDCYFSPTRRPHLSSFFERMQQRPAVQEYKKIHGSLLQK